MQTTRGLSVLLGGFTLMLAGACGQRDAGPADEAAPADEQAVSATRSVVSTDIPRSPAPADARVFFITPADGDTVPNPIRVEFGIDGMTIAPAGVRGENSGHHHMLIDTPVPDLGMPIPADANHIHFGDGSTWTELTLAPGEHTLQLLLADHAHIPHDPPIMSDPITITVQ